MIIQEQEHQLQAKCILLERVERLCKLLRKFEPSPTTSLATGRRRSSAAPLPLGGAARRGSNSQPHALAAYQSSSFSSASASASSSSTAAAPSSGDLTVDRLQSQSRMLSSRRRAHPRSMTVTPRSSSMTARTLSMKSQPFSQLPQQQQRRRRPSLSTLLSSETDGVSFNQDETEAEIIVHLAGTSVSLVS